MRVFLFLLGFCCANLAQADWARIAPATLQAQFESGAAPLVIDVRSPEEFAAGHVPGAVNLLHTAITGHEPALQGWQQKPVVLYCRSGRRAGLAAEILQQQGFQSLRLLEGDMPAWEAAGRPVAK